MPLPSPGSAQTTDIAIIGGGIIGCALAYYLSASHREVTVFEQEHIGGQASSTAAGLLAPLGPLSGPGPLADFLLESFAYLRSLVPMLEDASGLSLGYQQSGALRVVRNAKRVEPLRKRFVEWQPLKLTMHWLSGEEARQIEPQLPPEVCAAVYAPEEAQIEPRQLVQAFATLAQRQGARFFPHTSITQLETTGQRVTGLYTAQGEYISCQTVIIANGAWAAMCAEWLQISLPITPLYGQLLMLPQIQPPLHTIVFGEGAYVIPRGMHLLVGATKEERGFDTSTNPKTLGDLQAVAARLVPAISGTEISITWAGLRPRTPDSRPLLGYLPSWENVAIAAGHNSIGIISGALTGKCLTELVMTGQMPALIRPFGPERFLTPTA